MQQNNVVQVAKAGGDVTSFGIILGSLSNMLPSISAALAIVWTIIRIWETDTVQKWINKNN